jgi:hypothetical protein
VVASLLFTPRQAYNAVIDWQDRQGPWADQLLDVLLCLEIALLAVVLLLWPMPIVPLPPLFP